MGIEKHNNGQQFDLHDLGVLDGPPLKGAGIVVNVAAEFLDMATVALIVFDEDAAAAHIHVSSDPSLTSTAYPVSNSIAAQVRSENETVAICDFGLDASPAEESKRLRIRAMLASPVYGPEQDPIGALAVLKPAPHFWSIDEKERLEDMAYLVSQEVVLRASFETMRLMARERRGMGI